MDTLRKDLLFVFIMLVWRLLSSYRYHFDDMQQSLWAPPAATCSSLLSFSKTVLLRAQSQRQLESCRLFAVDQFALHELLCCRLSFSSSKPARSLGLGLFGQWHCIVSRWVAHRGELARQHPPSLSMQLNCLSATAVDVPAYLA